MSLVVRILLGNVTKALLIRRLHFVSQKKENLPYKKSPVRRELYKEQTAGGSSTLLDKWTSWWGRILGWIPPINLSLGSLVPWDSGNEAKSSFVFSDLSNFSFGPEINCSFFFFPDRCRTGSVEKDGRDQRKDSKDETGSKNEIPGRFSDVKWATSGETIFRWH